VLSGIVQTTVHAGLGKWLEQQQQVGAAMPPALQPVDRPSPGLQGHPLIVIWGARVCASFGSLLVVVLVRTPPPPPAHQ